jgi:hypothetical protein
MFRKKNTHKIGDLGTDAVYRRAGDRATLWRKIDHRQHGIVQYDLAMGDWIVDSVRVEDFNPAEDVETDDA